MVHAYRPNDWTILSVIIAIVGLAAVVVIGRTRVTQLPQACYRGTTIDDIIVNCAAYNGQFVEITVNAVQMASYTRRDRSIYDAFPEDDQTQYPNTLSLIVKSPSFVTRQIGRHIYTGTLRCRFDSRDATPLFVRVTELLNGENYQGPIVLRGIIQDVGAQTPIMVGHSILVTTNEGEKTTFHLSDRNPEEDTRWVGTLLDKIDVAVLRLCNPWRSRSIKPPRVASDLS